MAPALDASQIDEICSQLHIAVDAAFEGDTSNLEQRVEQPAYDVLMSGVTSKLKGVDTSTLAIPPTNRQSLVTSSPTWPRNTFIITNITQDRQTERLLLLNQENPRDNYKLKLMVRLFANTELPKFDVLVNGSPAVTADDTLLIHTPIEIFTQYADVLQNDATSEYANAFASDQLRLEIQNGHTLAAEHLSKTFGTQSEEFAVDAKSIRAVRSFDGGALVVGAIQSKWTRTAGANALATPASDVEKAIFSSIAYSKVIEATYANFVAIYIPSANSSDKVQVLGAERYPIYVASK
jgi:hypothetical protein